MSEHMTARRPGENVNWWKTNQGIAVVLTALFIALLGYIVSQPDTFTPLRDGFQVGFFPMASTGLCILFSLVMLVDHLRKEEMPDYALLDWKFFGFVIIAIAWAGVFFWLLVQVGYVITTPFYLFGLIYALGLRPAMSAFLAAVVISGIILAIFWIIGAPMPLGPEWLMEKWGLPVL